MNRHDVKAPRSRFSNHSGTLAPSLVTNDASKPLESICDIIVRDGGVIVANFLSSELLSEAMNASE